MATKKLGNLIKEARTAAGLTQEALAKKVDDCSASDISKAERAEKDLTTAQLKQIAKACGVTQKSLLDAAGTAAKTSTSAKTAAKTSASKSSGETSVKVTAAEKKLLEYYRAANSETRKAAIAVLKGEASIDKGLLNTLLNSATDQDGLISGILGGILNNK